LWWGHRIPVWSRPKWEGESWSLVSVNAYMYKWVVLPAFDGDEQRARHAMEDIHCAYGADHLHMSIKSPEVEKALGETLGKRGYTQDPDALDTWFSSQLWPHSTLGWPGPALPDEPPGPHNPEWAQMRYYYPTNVLVTARGIITLWVVRMV